MYGAKIYINNRQKLTSNLPDSLIIIPAFSRMQNSNDAAADFLQESNFLWLTGLKVPNCILVIDSLKDETHLVCPQKNDYIATFDGNASHDEMTLDSGIKSFISKQQLIEIVSKFQGNIYTIKPKKSDYFTTTHVYSDCQKMIQKCGKKMTDVSSEIAKLRAIKQPYEIEAMKRAIDLTVQAFDKAKLLLPNLTTEYQLEAEFGYVFRHHNAHYAYEPIVASGKNALTLHYNSNSQKLEQDAFVLIDIGARVDNYSADITRTYAFGNPPKKYLEIHKNLAESQRCIINLIRPGLGIKDYIEKSDKIMMDCLYNLGISRKKDDFENYRNIMPHALSHGLGLDVHDSLGGPEVFQPGMVLTVEPGIYLPDKNLGIRVEDDILVTENGYENLSALLSTQS